MKELIKVALIEDDPDDAAIVRKHLVPRGDIPFQFELEIAESLFAGFELLRKSASQVVLLDLFLPDSKGLETYRSVRSAFPDIPIVVLTSLNDEAVAVKTMSQGAQDYLLKGPALTGTLLQRALRYSVERSQWQDRARSISQLEAQLLERQKADRAKDEFVGTVSHELRTPLGIIQAAMDSLALGLAGTLSPKGLELVELSRSNSERLSRVVGSLLDLSRLDSGKALVNRLRLDLGDLTRDAVEGMRIREGATRLRIVVDLPPGLPAVEADPDLATQLLINLLDNAMRFADSEVRVSARVVQSAESGKAAVQITVADDGPGIPIADQARLFDRYAQVQRARGSGYRGTGLGLAISKQIAESHGGRLWVESESGQGARFHFILPA